MTSYSHRDHRGFRAAYRLLGTVAAATTALVVASLLAPWAWLGELGVVALALLGGLAVVESGGIVDGYVDDLGRVSRGIESSGLLRVEVESRIELERPVFVGARRSPNVRRPMAEPSREHGGAALSGPSS